MGHEGMCPRLSSEAIEVGKGGGWGLETWSDGAGDDSPKNMEVGQGVFIG